MVTKKKKICFIVSTPMTANAFLLNHFEALSKYYSICLVANFDDTLEFDTHIKIVKKHIPINRKISILSDLRSLFHLYNFLNSEKFDAVHSVTPKAGLIGMLAAKLVSSPNRIHIFTGQVWSTKKGVIRFFLKQIDAFINNLTTCVLVDGNSQRLFLIKEKVVSENKSKVLGAGSISGVDHRKFKFDPLVKKELREQLDLNDDIVVFGYLGRLSLDKGLLDLAQAFRNINKRNKNSRLILVGPDEEFIKERVINIFGDEGIIFYGPTNMPSRIMQIFDIFCLPSYREGFGTSVIEASLLGLPIICSDTYGLMDTIQDGITGLRHKTKCIQDIENKMELLINNQEYRLRLGRNGKQYVINNFLSEQITSEWLGFYRNLLN